MVPKRLSDYPWVIVNLSCKLCARRGRYRLARLAARYGPDAALERVLADLACDCPYWRTNPRRYDPRCGARFEDLDRLPPQDVPRVEPVQRRRAPAREDVPQHRPQAARDLQARPPMLSDWTAPHIVVVCDACSRRESFETAAIRAATVDDVRLTDLRQSLTASCPRARAGAIADQCGARLELP